MVGLGAVRQGIIQAPPPALVHAPLCPCRRDFEHISVARCSVKIGVCMAPSACVRFARRDVLAL